MQHPPGATAIIRDVLEPGTTANNLSMIERSRGRDAWVRRIIGELQKRAG